MFTKDPVLMGLILAVIVLGVVYWMKNRTPCGRGRMNLTALGAPRWKSSGPYVNRRKDGFTNPYTRTDYPKRYKPAADGTRSIAAALTDADPNVVQAAKFVQWKVFTGCTRGAYYSENRADKRMKEFVVKDIDDLCRAGYDAAKGKASADATASATDASKKANCKEYCGAKAFELGYWCRHPTDRKKCCRKDNGKGGCADKLRDDPVVAAPTTGGVAGNAAPVTQAPTTQAPTTAAPVTTSSGVSGVTAYKDANFKGIDKTFPVGDYPELTGGWDDAISSIKVPQGFKVILYSKKDYGGEQLPLDANEHKYLSHFGFKDSIGYPFAKKGVWSGKDVCGNRNTYCWNDTASSMKVMTA